MFRSVWGFCFRGRKQTCQKFEPTCKTNPTLRLYFGFFFSPHFLFPRLLTLVTSIFILTTPPHSLPHPPQSSVRNEVMATSHVTDEWMTLMEMSSLNCYIVRRYIATPSGVLRIYPGSLMDKAFDPTRRQWWGSYKGAGWAGAATGAKVCTCMCVCVCVSCETALGKVVVKGNECLCVNSNCMAVLVTGFNWDLLCSFNFSIMLNYIYIYKDYK